MQGTAPLAYLVEKSGVAPVPRRGRFGLYHFAVLLPDRVALGRFAAHALRRGLRPGTADHAVSEALYLNDPDGLGIEVYADRPRTFWPTFEDVMEGSTVIVEATVTAVAPSSATCELDDHPQQLVFSPLPGTIALIPALPKAFESLPSHEMK